MTDNDDEASIDERLSQLEETTNRLRKFAHANDDDIETLEHQLTLIQNDLQTRLDELETRLDNLDAINELISDTQHDHEIPQDKRKRAAYALKQLYQHAQQRGKASYDYSELQAALQEAVRHRQTLYDIMDEMVALVGDTDVCQKIDEPRSAQRNTRVELDVSGSGVVPSSVAGVEIRQGVAGDD